VGIIAGVWTAYWYVANQLAFMAVDRVLAPARAVCERKVSRGFPFRLEIACGSVHLADAQSGLAVDTGPVTATAPLYWPIRLDAAASAPVTIKTSADDPGVAADWSKASTNVAGGIRGLNGLTAEVAGLDLVGPIALPRLSLKGLAADRALVTLAPGQGRPGDYSLSVSLDTVRLRAADARALPQITASARLSAHGFGPSLGFNPERRYAAWIDKGGALDLEGLLLTIGPLKVTASGPLTVSKEGLVSGKIAVRLVGLDQLPILLEAFQPGSRAAAAFGRLLNAVTRKVDTPAGPAREVVLNVNDGNLYFGIVPIGTLPPLRLGAL
jgi:hypothetical protein